MLYNIPNNYRKSIKEMIPAFLRGYSHFYYANTDELLDDADFSDWVLAVFDSAGVNVADDIGVLEKDIISGTDYRFYTTFTIPSSLPGGVYYLVVYNVSDDSIVFQLNCIQVITADEVEKYALVEYKNSSNIFNYNYALGFYNSLFLPLNVIEQQPEIELKQTYSQTTGIRRSQRVTTAKVLKVEAYYFDDEANDMMLALSVHDDIRINEKVVTVKTAYQIETNRISSTQKGVIEFYDQSYSTINLQG